MAKQANVVWSNKFQHQRRVITAQDWKKLGAEGPTKTVVWDKDNNWSVPRSEVPLTDEQLKNYLARDNKFSVKES